MILHEYLPEENREDASPAVREAEARLWAQAAEEAVDEIGSLLERMLELARQSAGEDSPDRAALQRELDRLRGEIDRIAAALETIPGPEPTGTRAAL